MDILPISEVIFAKKLNSDIIQWQLFDLYKIASDFPLKVLPFGTLEISTVDGNECEAEIPSESILKVTARVTTGSRRKDLEGLKIPCGLVVCMNVLPL